MGGRRGGRRKEGREKWLGGGERKGSEELKVWRKYRNTAKRWGTGTIAAQRDDQGSNCSFGSYLSPSSRSHIS